MPSRDALLIALAAVAICGCDPRRDVSGNDRGTAPVASVPLRQLGARCGIRIGAAVAYGPLTSDPLYGDTIARELHILTPENEMKWGPIHPQRSEYAFERADAIMAFAAAHDMAVHGHTLVWHNQNPTWLTSGSFTRSEMIDILRTHIHTVVGRFAGRYLTAWDVVNEAVNADGTLRRSVWLDRIGPEYIDLAFRFAREADPAATLIYNDFGNEMVNSKSTAIHTLVSEMRSRGVPIDGIGFQMHLTTSGVPVQSVTENMERFASLGLEIYITEMDVRVQLPTTPDALTAQAGVYRAVLDACLGQRACKAFQMWGITDAHSWIPGTFRGFGAALMLDESYRPTPAYEAIADRLNRCG